MNRLWILSPLCALALSFGCDEPLEHDEDFIDDADGDVTARCTGCSIKLNTNKSKFDWSAADNRLGVWRDNKVVILDITSQFGPVQDVAVVNGLLTGKVNNQYYSNDKPFLGSVWHLNIKSTPQAAPVDVMMTLTKVATVDGQRLYTFEHVYNGSGAKPIMNCDADLDPKVASTHSYAMILTADIDIDDKGTVSDVPNTIFFGCLSGGVGKAGYWGYPRHTRSRVEFESAIRMVRADYCATGSSFTAPGQRLDIEDRWGVNGFVNPASPTEAIWGTAGALCVATPRLSSYTYAAVKAKCAALGGTTPPQCNPTKTMADYAGLYWSKNP